jgi:hypothetical protein
MWSEVGERTFFSPASIVEDKENVAKVRQNLKIAQSKQKSYADPKRRDVSFEVGDYVFPRVSPLRGTKRFHVKGKLAPRFVGPYQIVAKVGKLAYRLELPSDLAGVHPVFHISQLWRCLDPKLDKHVSTDAIDLQDNPEYLEYLMKILYWAEKATRSTTTRICKVLWSNHTER